MGIMMLWVTAWLQTLHTDERGQAPQWLWFVVLALIAVCALIFIVINVDFNVEE